MGKRSSSAGKQDVTEYRMSIHFGICLQADSVNAIWVDEKPAWTGVVNSNTSLNINLPDLFGGQKKEGGLIGAIDVLLGDSEQLLPLEASSRYGRQPDECPAFRGLTTLMFRGSTLVSTGYVGDYDTYPTGLYSQNIGFVWRMNSPIIAQKVEVEVTRAPKGLNPAKAMIGPDANAAHIVYECLTNSEWGMGGATALIDTDAFEDVGDVLFDEAFGLSMIWNRQTTIEAFVTEVLDHIQATLFVNPNTGLLSIKLLRDDYDVETLRVINPQNAKLSNYRRRSPGEIVNELSVTWTNPATEQEETVTAQDIASIQSQGGEKVSGSRNYYGIRNLTLATKVLARDLRASTAPLVSADAQLDRSAWDILPGEVVRLDWPRRGVNSVIARVGKVDYGKPRDSTIRASLLQDVFSLSRPPIKIMPPSDWVDPRNPPAPLDMQIITVPDFFVRNGAVQNTVVELGEDEVLAAALADSQSVDSLDYELVGEVVDPGGQVRQISKGAMTLTPKGVLTTELPAAASSLLPAAVYPNIDEAPQVGGFVFFGAGDTAQEIAYVSARSDSGWTLLRGVLDTVPRTWPVNTPVWSVNTGARIVDSTVRHAAGETVTYRGLDRTALGLLAFDDAPEETATLTARPHLPLRPANVKINGTGFGSVAIGSATSVTITWAMRNRLLEDTQVMEWTDGPVAPEYRQETVVLAYDNVAGNLIQTYDGYWIETELVFAKTDWDRYTAVRFVVESRRDDLVSLQSHSIVVTGFAGNHGAAAPPAPRPRTEPPSIFASPAADAFTVTAGDEVGADGSRLPAIVVLGQQDNPDARGLVLRFRRNNTVRWTQASPVELNRELVRYVVSQGVQGLTTYDVQLAYVINGVIGNWRTYPDVTTSRTVAGGLTGFESLQPLLDAVTLTAQLGEELGANAGRRIRELLGNQDLVAQSIFNLAADIEARQRYQNELSFIEGERIGTFVQRRTTEVSDALGLLVEDVSLIGARTAGGLGWLLRADTVQINEDGDTLVSALTQLQAETETTAAAIIELETVTATQAAASAAQLALIGAQVPGSSIFRLSETTLQVGLRGALGSVLDSLVATDGVNSSAISTLNSLTATQGSSLTSLTSTVGGHTSSISSLFSVTNGLGSRWTLALNVNNEITGLVADGATRSIVFRAGQVAIVDDGNGLSYTPATGRLKIVKGTKKTVLGAGSSLVLWSGNTSIADGAETVDNGDLGIGSGDSYFGGRTLSGPFDSGAPSATIIDLSSTWQSLCMADKTVRNGVFAFRVGVETSGDATPDIDGQRHYEIDFQIISVAWDFSEQETLRSYTGGGTLAPGAPVTFVGGEGAADWTTYAGTRSGRRRLYLQARIKPGSATTFASVRNGRLRGFYAI
jgi:hypothetical protein